MGSGYDQSTEFFGYTSVSGRSESDGSNSAEVRGRAPEGESSSLDSEANLAARIGQEWRRLRRKPAHKVEKSPEKQPPTSPIERRARRHKREPQPPSMVGIDDPADSGVLPEQPWSVAAGAWPGRPGKRPKPTPLAAALASEPQATTSHPTARAHRGLVKPRRALESPGAGGAVLFYGDSITWGMAHCYTGRYALTWPRMLQDRLKLYNLRVVESALCSRTTAFNDVGNEEWMHGCKPDDFNGAKHFVQEFVSAAPKWLVLMLGTNDLKERIRCRFKSRGRMDASLIAASLSQIIVQARQVHSASPFHVGKLNILVVAPPRVKVNALARELGYDEISEAISRDFQRAYHEMCLANDVLFVAPDVNMEASVDGIHITQDANVVVAEAVWGVMRTVLGPPRCGRPRRLKSPSSSNGKRLRRISSPRAGSSADALPSPSFGNRAVPRHRRQDNKAAATGSQAVEADRADVSGAPWPALEHNALRHSRPQHHQQPGSESGQQVPAFLGKTPPVSIAQQAGTNSRAYGAVGAASLPQASRPVTSNVPRGADDATRELDKRLLSEYAIVQFISRLAKGLVKPELVAQFLEGLASLPGKPDDVVLGEIERLKDILESANCTSLLSDFESVLESRAALEAEINEEEEEEEEEDDDDEDDEEEDDEDDEEEDDDDEDDDPSYRKSDGDDSDSSQQASDEASNSEIY